MAASIKCFGQLFSGGVWGGFAPPAKFRGVWGAAPPSQNRKIFEKFSKIFEKNFETKNQFTKYTVITLVRRQRISGSSLEHLYQDASFFQRQKFFERQKRRVVHTTLRQKTSNINLLSKNNMVRARNEKTPKRKQ